MPEATASGALIPGTNPDEAALYTDPGDNPAEANLWIRGENNGNNYQLTTLNNTNWNRFGKDSATNPNGWTFLPGGLILQWGVIINPVGAGQVILSDSNFDFPSTMINVFLNFDSNNLTYSRAHIIDNTRFSYQISTYGVGNLYWIAMGY
jgi:hypothetical protein